MSTVEITKDNIDEVLSKDGVVVLDFWAEWCGPCMSFGPIFEAASTRYPDIVFGKVNTEVEQELAAGANISSIPTLMIFRDSILLFREAGALKGETLDDLLTQIQELDMDELRKEIEKMEAAEENGEITDSGLEEEDTVEENPAQY